MERFGEKLHKLRTAHKMTLKELATSLGYTSHSHLSELEAGKKTPTVEFVIKVARIFEVTTDSLLMDEVDPEINLENGRIK